MAKAKLDLIGKTFGRLTVVGSADPNKFKQSRFICNCICGNATTVVGSSLKTGNTVSCGCAHKGNKRSKKTHCKRGHEFVTSNTYVAPGSGNRYCRTCWNERDKIKRPYNRDKWLISKYGIDSDEFEVKWFQQDGKCSICHKNLLRDKTTHVDHDHVTGKVRDLLCTRCNTGIGQFQEDPDALRRAANYLERHNA